MDTNVVASISPFEEQASLPTITATDGWSRPPNWCFSPDGNQIFASSRSFDGSPLCGAVSDVEALDPIVYMAAEDEVLFDWADFDTMVWTENRVIGFNDSQCYAIDPKTMLPLWHLEKGAIALSSNGESMILNGEYLVIIDTNNAEQRGWEGAPPKGAKKPSLRHFPEN